MKRVEVDVLVVGAGPAGLAAAETARRHGAGRVLCIDRDAEPGGMPRFCDHVGFETRFGLPCARGPAYAARLHAQARAQGVRFAFETTAIGWEGPTELAATSPDGLQRVAARVVVLATGCRERPRAARLVPGARPLGVFTTGNLQQLLRARAPVGRRAVVVGAEAVSFWAAYQLRRAGCEVVAMLCELDAHEAPTPWALWLSRGVPLACRTRLAAIEGARRVEAVVLVDARGDERRLGCDTVVFTGSFVPDHELARAGGVALDAGTRGPRVDQRLATTRPGVLAAGNLLHGAEPAAYAELEGRRAGAEAARLLGGAAPAMARLDIEVAPPLQWIVPGAIVPDTPGPPRFAIRAATPLAAATVRVEQAGRELFVARLGALTPGRPARLGSRWTSRVEPGAPVRVTVV